MAEATNKEIDVQVNIEKFNLNITSMPYNIIAEKNLEAYKIAAMQFARMANGELTAATIKREYGSYLDAPINMLNTVVNQTHLSGEAGINGQEATEFVRASVIEKLAEEIAEAKYPIIDYKESSYVSNAFGTAKTPEQRQDAISKYPQLEQAFKFSDAMTKITGNDATGYVSQWIKLGKVPEMTPELQDAVKRQEQIDKEAIPEQTELER